VTRCGETDRARGRADGRHLHQLHSSDRDWAFRIAKELGALGHAPHVHEWEIKSGDDIYACMQERHDAADHVLCVVSDDYLKAPYSTLKRNAAL